MARVLILVTHLLGVGHLTRAAAIGRALARGGHEVTLVSGGRPAPLVPIEGLSLVQLPPVAVAGTAFGALLDREGAPAGESLMAERRDILLKTLVDRRPDVVVTELFPFGRRVLAAEFTDLLDAAHALRPHPAILASVRDILVAPSKPDRVAEAHARLAARYDGVLVHGDPGLVPLEASWPLDPGVAPLLRYTGYVGDDRPLASAGPRGEEILVSGGGSAASLPLYRAALGAAAGSPRPWRVLVGRGVSEEAFLTLLAAAPPNATVERARPDFPALLGAAAVSVSQAGYNTAVDLLRARTPAVLVPFEEGRETEQRLRAERLAARGLGVVLPEAELSPEALGQAVEAALAGQALADPGIALDGAERTVALVEEFAACRQARAPSLDPGVSWTALDEALRHLADSGRTLSVWWRDDDAVAHTPALDRLLALARALDVPLALAAISARIEPSLAPRLMEEPSVATLVHGLSHANHAGSGEKKAEFASGRPLPALEADAAEGLSRLREALGARALPVLVPPWNRIAPALVPRLAALGYRGLSTFRDRAPLAGGDEDRSPPLIQVNTHIDPIDWHGSRDLLDAGLLVATAARAVERRLDGRADPDEAIGLLTHHLVHDEAVWRFCAALLERLRACPALVFPRTERLFDTPGESGADRGLRSTTDHVEAQRPVRP